MDKVLKGNLPWLWWWRLMTLMTTTATTMIFVAKKASFISSSLPFSCSCISDVLNTYLYNIGHLRSSWICLQPIMPNYSKCWNSPLNWWWMVSWWKHPVELSSFLSSLSSLTSSPFLAFSYISRRMAEDFAEKPELTGGCALKHWLLGSYLGPIFFTTYNI